MSLTLTLSTDTYRMHLMLSLMHNTTLYFISTFHSNYCIFRLVLNMFTHSLSKTIHHFFAVWILYMKEQFYQLFGMTAEEDSDFVTRPTPSIYSKSIELGSNDSSFILVPQLVISHFAFILPADHFSSSFLLCLVYIQHFAFILLTTDEEKVCRSGNKTYTCTFHAPLLLLFHNVTLIFSGNVEIRQKGYSCIPQFWLPLFEPMTSDHVFYIPKSLVFTTELSKT